MDKQQLKKQYLLKSVIILILILDLIESIDGFLDALHAQGQINERVRCHIRHNHTCARLVKVSDATANAVIESLVQFVRSQDGEWLSHI
jgi:hypothetical protein